MTSTFDVVIGINIGENAYFKEYERMMDMRNMLTALFKGNQDEDGRSFDSFFFDGDAVYDMEFTDEDDSSVVEYSFEVTAINKDNLQKCTHLIGNLIKDQLNCDLVYIKVEEFVVTKNTTILYATEQD